MVSFSVAWVIVTAIKSDKPVEIQGSMAMFILTGVIDALIVGLAAYVLG